jgi:phosphoribosylglycinamide formyltransferase-1
MLEPLYTPVPGRRMHVVVFGSGSGTTLEALLRVPQDLFEIKALFTDRLCRFQEIGASRGIPVIYHSFAHFFKKRGVENPQDLITRTQYDAENVRLILETVGTVDLILLAGYMRLIYAPLLQNFKNKIINIHPADLTQLTPSGQRRYVGANAVYDALCAGEKRTRSSVILVDEGVDSGPVLLAGPWVSYEEGYPITQERARLHQEKQKIHSDWPACIAAVTAIAQGDFIPNIKINQHLGQCESSRG